MELINEFSKIAGYKVNIQKSILYLCMAINNHKIKFKNMYSSTKYIRYSEIYLAKDMQISYKIQLWEIKSDPNNMFTMSL